MAIPLEQETDQGKLGTAWLESPIFEWRKETKNWPGITRSPLDFFLKGKRLRGGSIIAVGMTWNDLRLILLTLGVVVARYALSLAFGPFAPAGH
jgi:hypothetical protein